MLSLIEAAQSDDNIDKSVGEDGSKNTSSTTTGEQQPQRVLPVDSKADLCVEKTQLPKDPSTFLSEIGQSSQQKFKKTLEIDAENEQCPVFGPKLPPSPSRSSSSGGGGGTTTSVVTAAAAAAAESSVQP